MTEERSAFTASASSPWVRSGIVVRVTHYYA
ncbi:hypothetical protein SFR_2874 [Streptomyces sp. FR-008]|nr:hypothetical protein SFR_2874 [Streptomyces sp. FR-008]